MISVGMEPINEHGWVVTVSVKDSGEWRVSSVSKEMSYEKASREVALLRMRYCLSEE